MPCYTNPMTRLPLSLLTALVALPLLLTSCPQNKANTDDRRQYSDQCHDEFVAGQQPQASVNTVTLCHTEYISVYDPARKVPLAVGEKLRPEEFDGSVSRADNFQPDPALPSDQSAQLSDFKGSGYARGHMAPAADFTSTDQAMQESFYLSNMVPQNTSMNSGIWSSLENATRACVKSLGEAYVLTGPIFEGQSQTIGEDNVAVPSSLYKVVVSGNAARAFIMPNRKLPPARSDFSRYEVTVDEVQRATGLTLFPEGEVNRQKPGQFCSGSYGS